jgi:hypothetical protein
MRLRRRSAATSKKRFANGPFAKFSFENIYLRGGSDGAFNLFGGEYLYRQLVSGEYYPETVAGLAPHARKVMGNEMGVAWNEVVTDMAWDQIVYDSKRGILMCREERGGSTVRNFA